MKYFKLKLVTFSWNIENMTFPNISLEGAKIAPHEFFVSTSPKSMQIHNIENPLHWCILAFNISICHSIKAFIHSTAQQIFISLSTILRRHPSHFLLYNSQPIRYRILGIVFLVQAYTSPKNQWTLRGNHHSKFKH